VRWLVVSTVEKLDRILHSFGVPPSRPRFMILQSVLSWDIHIALPQRCGQASILQNDVSGLESQRGWFGRGGGLPNLTAHLTKAFFP